ncbi:MAG: hypothetical protein ABIQ40_04300 [Bacteroidia bacterium]
MATNQKPQEHIFIEEFFSAWRKKTPTTLLEFSLPTQAVIKLVPLLNRFRITFELEKRTKEDLVLIEVEQEKSTKIYWLHALCDLLKTCYTRGSGLYFLYETRVEEILQHLRVA